MRKFAKKNRAFPTVLPRSKVRAVVFTSKIFSDMTVFINSGRWLFVLPFAVFGLLHFGPLEFSLPYVPTWLPFPAAWVYFVGACFVAFVASVFLKKHDQLAAVLLAVCLLLFVALIHVPGAVAGDFKSVIGATRDLCIAGGALMYAKAFARDRRFRTSPD
jgi:hypothetical protein